MEATSSAQGSMSGFDIDGKDPGLADTTRAAPTHTSCNGRFTKYSKVSKPKNDTW